MKTLGLLILLSIPAGADMRVAQIHRMVPSVPISDIRAVLHEIDRDLPRYFPHGPFTREDFISLAMTESAFNKHCMGTSGERGVFQVMPSYYGNRPDSIRINTELAFRVLKGKYREHPDRRRAIIAYNGYLVRRGRLLDGYWVRFNRHRARVLVAMRLIPRLATPVDSAAPVVDPAARQLEIDVYGGKV